MNREAMAERKVTNRPNPFPGLRAFSPEEGDLFFGREESILNVVEVLKEKRFVTLLGASGSGKSSLVMSGVIPSLMRENKKEKALWSYLVFRPALNPVDHFAVKLSSLSAAPGFNQVSEVSVAASFHNSVEGLTDVMHRIRKNLRQQIVIVIDQFEELFRVGTEDRDNSAGADASRFIDLLVNAMKSPDQGLHIILTMRTEYVSHCAAYRQLTNLINAGSYLLPVIGADQITTVITEPLRLSGASADPALVALILDDLKDMPVQLPVLQHLMMRLWARWNIMGEPGTPVGISDYEAVGGVTGAIDQHAGQALKTMDERHHYVAARLFRTITKRVEGGPEIRNPLRVSEIAARTGCDEEEIIEVADIFRADDYSLITPSGETPLNGESMLDLAHESIISLWSTLRSWMDKEEVSVKFYRQLAAAAERHQEGRGPLLPTADLLLALKWRDENRPTLAWAVKINPAFERTMLYLKNSEEEYNARQELERRSGSKKIRRSRFTALLFGLAALMALAAIGTVYSLKTKTERQKSVALQMKEEAVVLSDLLMDSLEILTSENRITLLREQQQRASTEEKMRKAESRVREAEKEIKELDQQESAARHRASEMNRIRMVVLAKSLAVRSLNHAANKDLQILLAWQAYLFNERYNGSVTDADLFAGFYDIARRYGNRYYSRYTTDDARITAMAAGEGELFFTADSRGRIMRWRIDQPQAAASIIWSGERIISSMAVNPDAKWLACGTESSEIMMIPIDTDRMGYQLQGDGGVVTSLLFTDSNHLLAADTGGGVNEWNLITRKAERILNENSSITSIDLSEGGEALAALTDDGRVIWWKRGAADRQLIAGTEGRGITAYKFLPGEVRIITGDRDGMMTVWDPATGMAEQNIPGHLCSVIDIAFNRIESQMVTSDMAGEIRLWATDDLTQPPVVFTDGDDEVLRLAFCDKGNAFLAATSHGVTRRPANVGSMTAGLCDRVTRNLTEQEWSAYVGADIEYEATCPDKGYKIRVRQILGAR